MKRVILALLLLGACGDEAESEDRVAAILELEGDVSNGAALYGSDCAGCHGLTGEGGSDPAMSDAIDGLSDEDLITVILDGVGGMPAHDYLEDQEIRDILDYAKATY